LEAEVRRAKSTDEQERPARQSRSLEPGSHLRWCCPSRWFRAFEWAVANGASNAATHGNSLTTAVWLAGQCLKPVDTVNRFRTSAQ
jgi:uncharacterized protein (DUF2237 family)